MSGDPPLEPEALQLLSELVAIAPTNLEDPAHGRWEKPNYPAIADRLVRLAREWGLPARIFDPVQDPVLGKGLRGIPRPNVIVELDVGAVDTVVILAHLDVVPVPAEQLARWKSPPHELTFRSNGRYYGRGSNDDLGSGVVAGLLALRRLKARTGVPRNVRLVVCCDEETGGEGGVEAVKAHDAALPEGDRGRLLRGCGVLIPDGSPRVSAGSSGVLFLDAGFDRPVSYEAVVVYGTYLVRFHETARSWKSQYTSPDWPDHSAPEEKVTGRATVTRFDLSTPARGALRPRLTRLHAETDATNQIAQSVTFVFEGPGEKLLELRHWMLRQVPKPYRLARTDSTALTIPTGALAMSVVGRSYHAGYPHLALNPVPAALALIEEAINDAKIEDDPLVEATFGVDVRLPPEFSLEDGRARTLGPISEWIRLHPLGATIDAPPSRQRGGYALPADHPDVRRLERILERRLGARGVFGEYGGTDASSLVGLTTPAGDPLPALVFGSMDREAHIHEAEESLDPRLLAGVVASICDYVTEP
ncbi:MAG TPA: M20/M25/M40 family metallo-hydrolase [Thermoplasmata archaeon]|nr:M20/M25/M40 family metallo-hydrolase [Thermoplasmata archaeon]